MKLFVVATVALAIASSVFGIALDDAHKKRGPKYPDTLVITQENGSLDGYTRQLFKINGQTPGPLIEIDQGDRIELNVINRCSKNISIHFHGINQRGTPYMDGMPGVNQWPIPPGGSFFYNFSVPDQYGQYWYHAHFKEYLSDGVRGPIYVHPAQNVSRPYSQVSSNANDVAAMMAAEQSPIQVNLHDWRHVTDDQMTSTYEFTGLDQICVETIIINGQGRQTCQSAAFLEANSGGRYQIFGGTSLNNLGCIQTFPTYPGFNATQLTPHDCQNTTSPLATLQAPSGSSWVQFNLINMGNEYELAASLDAHDMWVVSQDGVFIQPTKVQAVSIIPGGRYGVMVNLNQAPGAYYFRFPINSLPQINQGLAIFQYPTTSAAFRGHGPNVIDDPSKEWLAYNATTKNGATFLNSAGIAPFTSNDPPATSNMTIRLTTNSTQLTTLVTNLIPYSQIMQTDVPELFSKATGDPRLFFNIPAGSVVDLILENHPALSAAHPMHLHGHNFWVLGSAPGTAFNYNDVAGAVAAGDPNISLTNVPYKDGHNLPQGGYLVLRYIADNPGAWFLHCHIGLHQQSGMGVVLFEGQDQLPPIPPALMVPPHYTTFENSTGDEPNPGR